MSSAKILDRILNEIYEELYKRATPHASFKQLVKEADWVDASGNTYDNSVEKHTVKWFKDNGYKKDIHYKNYVIDKKVAESVVKNVMDKYTKLTVKDIKRLNDNLSIGCGPLTQEEKEELEKTEADK